MSTNNNKEESEAYMGFTLAKDMQERVLEIVRAKDWDQEEARVIPGADGMVLVKEDSKAFFERKAEKGVFMIPVRIKGMSSGVEAERVFFVCTK